MNWRHSKEDRNPWWPIVKLLFTSIYPYKAFKVLMWSKLLTSKAFRLMLGDDTNDAMSLNYTHNDTRAHRTSRGVLQKENKNIKEIWFSLSQQLSGIDYCRSEIPSDAPGILMLLHFVIALYLCSRDLDWLLRLGHVWHDQVLPTSWKRFLSMSYCFFFFFIKSSCSSLSFVRVILFFILIRRRFISHCLLSII